jgi:hypothetical protein
MPSRSRAVASTPGLPQYPISPAPTSTPLDADPDGLDEDSGVGAAGDEQLTPSNTLSARTIRQIRLIFRATPATAYLFWRYFSNHSTISRLTRFAFEPKNPCPAPSTVESLDATPSLISASYIDFPCVYGTVLS